MLRFPSGNALNYTGSGAFGFNPVRGGVVSMEGFTTREARLSVEYQLSADPDYTTPDQWHCTVTDRWQFTAPWRFAV